MRRLLHVILAAGASVALHPAVASAVAPVGISDNKPSTFADARFAELGVRYARLVAPYDAAREEPERLDAWIAAARAVGAETHVAFEHRRGDKCPDVPCQLPSAEAYGEAFDAFRARHPDVRVFTPWNEANHSSQPTWRDAPRAAAYYEAAAARCPGCQIVAADVLDIPNMMSWLAAFRASLTLSPKLWGLHNYGDVNDDSTVATDALLAAVDGQVWLTETGGIVFFRDRAGEVLRPYDEARARDAVERVFALLARSPGRVTRAYLYHWQAGQSFQRFDAGLIGPDGSPRPAFDVVRRELRPALGELTSAARLAAGDGAPGPPAPGLSWGAARAAGLRLGGVARVLPRRRLRLVATCRAGGARCRGEVELRHSGLRRSWQASFDLRAGRRAGIVVAPVRSRQGVPRRIGRLSAVARLVGARRAVRRTVRVSRINQRVKTVQGLRSCGNLATPRRGRSYCDT